ncbi:epidermal growth factor receptor kinase substrate 8-like isoform X4 [Trichogramma pretiosum]|uniref:epidermal growth factor receptor kinase substrate 8-like isoform X4 n=1 Tax=Trichogramma pretiosum TaxID=7493 RepID=UPI000C71AB7C|nr:epidermal growth factor receptor kinase substrate 8-like isoform X4 [Trichogramma pretiosum]
MPYYNSPSHGNSHYSKAESGPVAPSQSARSSATEATYVMEHLATFTVTKETGIVYPADGMRRLLQLEKSNGIWSQKMQLRLERNWVLIMDHESGAVMERFPAAMIQEPTAFTSRDPMEMYNNILVFTVTDDPSLPAQQQRAEMHIFQCQSVSAQDLVEDLKMLQAGKMLPAPVGSASPTSSAGPRGAHIPPPPTLPPPEPPLNGMGSRDGFASPNSEEHSHHHHHHPAHGGHSQPPPHHHHHHSEAENSRDEQNDEVSSTSSDKYERDVTILNHCFDDIEKFIARLQHAAAASRELERRRRNRKSKKRNPGDGMLTMRAKPPPELEFVDIFQKFKLSFNLLAKLKSHIHDPNAPELVHFLFTPLALIVDATNDTSYEPNLPAKVVSPLLTREAVNLLMNCVTSKETELWHALGDAWLVPREQWKAHVPPYHPVFMDGWSPNYPIPDDREPMAIHNEHLASLLNADKRKRDNDINDHPSDPYYNQTREVDESHYGSDYLDYDSREDRANPDAYFERGYDHHHHRGDLYSRDAGVDREQERRAHSDISVDSIERGPRTAGSSVNPNNNSHGSQVDAWLDELMARRAKIVQVTYPRTANNDKELTVVRGEYLEILDDTRKWWKARNSRGQVAHVPHTIVTPHHGNPQAASPDGSDHFNSPVYPSRYPRQSSHGYNYEVGSREGDFVKDMLNALDPQDSEMDGANTSPGSEPPHRAHAIPPPAPADWVRKERLGKKEDKFEELDSEIDNSKDDVSSTKSYKSDSNSAVTFKSSEYSTSSGIRTLDRRVPLEDDTSDQISLLFASALSNNSPPPTPPPLPSLDDFNRSLSRLSLRSFGSSKESNEDKYKRELVHNELKGVLSKINGSKNSPNDIRIEIGKPLPYEIQTWDDKRNGYGWRADL